MRESSLAKSSEPRSAQCKWKAQYAKRAPGKGIEDTAKKSKKDEHTLTNSSRCVCDGTDNERLQLRAKLSQLLGGALAEELTNVLDDAATEGNVLGGEARANEKANGRSSGHHIGEYTLDAKVGALVHDLNRDVGQRQEVREQGVEHGGK